MWIVITAVDPEEGVVGLNGDWYLQEDNGELMKFKTRQDAWDFMDDNSIFGGDDEYVDYIEVEGEDNA